MANLINVVLAVWATALAITCSCSDSGRLGFRDGVTSRSVINQTGASGWRLTKVDVGQRYGITTYYFFDSSHGYGAAYQDRKLFIYFTSDHGTSWTKRAELDGVTVNDLVFPSTTRGIIVGTCPESELDRPQGCILSSDDGGSNWRKTFSYAGHSLTKLAFEADGTAVAIGAAETFGRVNADIVLLSSDYGQTWVDRSSNLKPARNATASGEGDGLSSSLFTQDGALLLLSVHGYILETLDRGQTWHLKDSLPETAKDVAFSRFGYDRDSGSWAAGGTMAIEGKRSVVATKTNSSWNLHDLKDHIFSDAQLISNKEFLATAVNYGSPNHPENALLFSSDDGKSWSKLVGGTDTKKLGSIFVFSPRQVLVIADDGSGLLLERD
jgi:photosystem II stability/assembly factor-like uncharacterized protein